MSEDYSDYFDQNEQSSEDNGEHWRGVKPPEGGWHEVTQEPSASEEEQVPVWVKLTNADRDVVVRAVVVDFEEPPSFNWCYRFAWRMVLAFFWVCFPFALVALLLAVFFGN